MAILLSPWTWLVLLLTLSGTHGAAYHHGWKHATNHYAAAKLAAIEVARQEEARQAKAGQVIEEEYEEVREVVRTVYVTIKEKADENIAKNPDYSECSLDADGLRLYNARPNTYNTAPGTSIDSKVP